MKGKGKGKMPYVASLMVSKKNSKLPKEGKKEQSKPKSFKERVYCWCKLLLAGLLSCGNAKVNPTKRLWGLKQLPLPTF